jgi:hypothetical protein
MIYKLNNKIAQYLKMISPNLLQLSAVPRNEPVKTRIQLKIPHKYHTDPILSKLILDFKLQVNLVAAILGKDETSDGWFDLEFEGYRQQIDNALTYLSGLKIEFWQKSDEEKSSW